ncbi:hypothetical protein [Sphingomonas sp.]|uniref:hypothetical protein n=1 Tax=Sphingomonas sp. TaxID=28214 RepID=UPI0031D705A7
MENHPLAPPRRRPPTHMADARIVAGPIAMRARIKVSSGGLLAIGGLVSSILLSTAVLVGVSTRHRARRTEP